MAAPQPPAGPTEPSTALSLRVGDWVEVDGRPWRITDLRFRCDGGRIVHFAGRPPLAVGPRHTVRLYRRA